MADRLCHAVPRAKLVLPPQHWPHCQDTQDYRRRSAKYAGRELREALSQEDKETLWQLAQSDGYEIALRNDTNEGAVCYSSSFEEFGIVQGEDTAWFPSCGSTEVFFVDVDTLPTGEDFE